MTPNTISQPVNNTPLETQSGSGFVLKENVTFSGGDALIGFSASAWSGEPGPISMRLWLDEQPTSGLLTLSATAGAMHLSLGHSWIWCQDVTPGEHVIMLEAGETTLTDQNDYACVTVWEMGDGCAVRWAEDAPCPVGTGQQLIRAHVETQGGQLLVSGSSSGWVETAGGFVSASLAFDGGDPVEMQVCANNPAQHLAVVPTDMVVAANRGDHEVQLAADGLTSTDGDDTAHLSVVEWVNPDDAPVVCEMSPPLQNAVCETQDGSGGGTIAASQFSTSGGDLLVRVNVSCWTAQTGGTPLQIGIQVDGTSMGFAQIWANPSATHMAAVTNDLVVPGVAAGSHTLNLMAEANVITDLNDRVSVLIMEFPS